MSPLPSTDRARPEELIGLWRTRARHFLDASRRVEDPTRHLDAVLLDVQGSTWALAADELAAALEREITRGHGR